MGEGTNWMFLVAYFLGSAATFWTAFCRLAMTTHATLVRVRLLLWSISAFALVSIGTTVIFGYLPGWFHLALILTILAFQIRTARLWFYGVPHFYRKSAAKNRADRCFLLR